MAEVPAVSSVIGVFDSGVGGLSVLQALRRRLPEADYIYVADSGHAPYGEREPAHVLARAHRVTRFLEAEGARMIVVACNTATALAVDDLRQRWPSLQWVAVEPGVKPAAAQSRTGRIAVLATRATLSSERFARLVERHAQGTRIFPVPCVGLATAIEQGDDRRIDSLLADYCGPLAAAAIDTAVLGCTHYPLIADRIARHLGAGIRILDTSDAVARRAADLWSPRGTGTGRTRLFSTGETEILTRLARSSLGLEDAASAVDF